MFFVSYHYLYDYNEISKSISLLMSVKNNLLNILIIFISLYNSELNGQDQNYDPTESLINTLTFPTQFSKEPVKLHYILPPENKVVFYKEIFLSWENPNRNEDQRLQIATDRLFSEKILDTLVKTQAFIVPSLQKHTTYYWRVISNNYEVNDEVTFFKTTSIMIDESMNMESIEIIPTWMDDMALLYVDNPNFIDYNIKIYNQQNEVITNKSSRLEKFAIETESWLKGDYNIKVTLNNLKEYSKTFTIR